MHRHLLDRSCAIFYLFPGNFEAQPLDRFRGRHSGLDGEDACEITSAHASAFSQSFYTEALTQSLPHPRDQRRKSAGGAIEVEQRRELRLPGGPAVIDYHLLRGPFGNVFPQCIAAELAGADTAQEIQLQIEYAPAPPFNAGAPETAPRAIVERVREQYAAAVGRRRAAVKIAADRLLEAIGL